MSRSAQKTIREWYPVVVRLSRGLTGGVSDAKRVTDAVLKQAGQVLSVMRPSEVPEYWFYHHTILESRAIPKPVLDPASDLLAQGSEPPSVEYLALIKAVRSLPTQQREAFILHHGERLNTRLLGVTMDCSTFAAENHLAEANRTIETIVGPELASLLPTFTKAFTALTPKTEPLIVPSTVGSPSRLAGRLRWLVRPLVVLIFWAAVAYAGWRYRQRLVPLFHELRSLDVPAATQPR